MASYGIIYSYQFSSRNGHSVHVNIAKKNYIGRGTTRALGRAPILRQDNNGNISGTSLELYVEAKVAGEYKQFFTSNADEFMVVLFRNGVQLWTGFVIPELYSEPDTPAPYDVRIIATDGLGELKRHDYELEGIHTLREHLAYMLGKTGIERNIWMTSRMSVVTNAIGYLSENLLDVVTISLDHEIGENCYDVLQHLLASFNMSITMRNAEWYVFRETDLSKEITDNGVRASMGQGTVKSLPVVPFGSMTTNKWWPVGYMSSAIIPARKSISLTAPYKYYDNLLKSEQWTKTSDANYDEQENAFVLPTAGAQISQEVIFSSDEYVRDRLVLKMRARNIGNGEDEAPLRIQVRMNGKMYTVGDMFYLVKFYPTASRPEETSYSWNNAMGNIDLNLAAPAESDTFEDAQDVEVVIPLYDIPPRNYAHAYSIKVTLTNAVGTYGIYLYDVSLSQYDRAEGIKVTVNIENNAREKAEDVNLHMADTAKLNPGAKFLMPGIPLSPTGLFFSGWKVSSLLSTADYVKAMAADYAMKVGSVRRQYTGRLHVGDEKIPTLFIRDSIYYLLKSYSYDLYEDEMEVDMISVPDATVGNDLQ